MHYSRLLCNGCRFVQESCFAISVEPNLVAAVWANTSNKLVKDVLINPSLITNNKGGLLSYDVTRALTCVFLQRQIRVCT